MILVSTFQVAGVVPVTTHGDGTASPSIATAAGADDRASSASATAPAAAAEETPADVEAAEGVALSHDDERGTHETASATGTGTGTTTGVATQSDDIASRGTATGVAQPAPMAIGAHAPQTPGLGGAFFALVLVLGLILGLAWVLKRLPGSGLRAADGLRVVASIPLGAKERAAVVQVGDEQLLLGIGPGGVRTLHLLPTPLPEPAAAAMPSLRGLPDFKQLLAQRLRKDP